MNKVKHLFSIPLFRNTRIFSLSSSLNPNKYFTSGSCYSGELNSFEGKSEYYVRKNKERGQTNIDWLRSLHTFSFAPSYKDNNHRGFMKLRVINEDFVQPGKGFETHSHINMEIITYVLAGSLQHRDSLGNGSIIKRGEIQRMSAGRGITHSEFNASQSQMCHFLQIWIMPDHLGTNPSYEQKAFNINDMTGKCKLLCSKDGREGSISIDHDADVYAAIVSKEIKHSIAQGRAVWVHVATGNVVLNGVPMEAGDGVGIKGPIDIHLQCTSETAPEVLIFDMVEKR